MIRFHIENNYVALGDNEVGSSDVLVFVDNTVCIDRKRPEFKDGAGIEALIMCLWMAKQGYKYVKALAERDTNGDLFAMENGEE